MTDITILSLNIRSLRNKQKYIVHLSRKYRPDFIFIQETNIDTHYKSRKYTSDIGLKEGWFSLGNECRGVAIFLVSDRFKVVHAFNDTRGRIVIIRVESGNQTFTLANIYAPAKSAEKQDFYENLIDILNNNYREDTLIIGGDFNYITSALDKQTTLAVGPPSRKTFPNLNFLEEIERNFNLVDAYRTLEPMGRDTTMVHRSYPVSTRLDRVYAPNHFYISRVSHLEETLEYTDHKAVLVTLDIKNKEIKRKSSHWKFNNSLLEIPLFVELVSTNLNSYLQDIQDPHFDLTQTWPLLKSSIKQQSQLISTLAQGRRRQEYEQLKYTLLHTDDEIVKTETLLKLEELNKYTYRGAEIRCKNYLSNEGPSKLFLSFEQNVQSSKIISNIIDSEGNKVDDYEDIKNIFTKHFTTIYSEEPVYTDAQDNFLKFCNQLDKTDEDLLGSAFTLDELRTALDSTKNNKSPGPDGLTFELYKTFFPLLGPLLLRLYSDAIKLGHFPPNFNEAYITLLPKKSENNTSPSDYRPISLLNTDYKLLTKMIFLRMKPLINQLIGHDQYCCIPDRNIDGMTHFLRDFIMYSKDKNLNVSLLSVDQEKAFDRVSHSFLFKVLEKCKISSLLIRYIKLVYTNATSRLIINHSLSRSILIQRSVRQGCPLSPFLYILCLEPFLESVRSDPSIIGINIPGRSFSTIKVKAYADDTTFFPSSEQDIENILKKFTLFGEASGSKININKSSVMGLGKWKFKENCAFRIVDKIKICGIVYTCNPLFYCKDQWENIFVKASNLIKLYQHTGSTIFGRAVLINSLVIPKIVYLANITEPPPKFINKLNKLIRSFIFKNTIRSIKHTTLIQNKEDGGINLQDVKTKIQSLRLKFVGQVVRNPTNFPLTIYYYGLRLSSLLPIHNDTPHYFGTVTHPFYRSISRVLPGNEHLIHNKTKESYTTLKKLLQESLVNRIKWGRVLGVTEFKDTFINLHSKHIPPKAREISYRLIFGMTPMVRRRANDRECILCHLENADNEKHMYLECPLFLQVRSTVMDLLEANCGNYVNVNLSIILNKLPKLKNKMIHNFNLIIVSEYRNLVWASWLKCLHNNKVFDPNHLELTFRKIMDFRVENYLV